ncbi:hypothetical protein E1B28_012155 [Marasmius oreades]|uniref:C2H2-type domain-containing protein n=1 Tax=Marasmius oreades TaxID=181124 RepID=A0A9P7RRW7_9AGAR|nr:uncharacterized protein E1B28_012155 [Marasmius oreades]KAG7088131.1 hypothetical protein E1B28_012155 [Marasmius oreades]
MDNSFNSHQYTGVTVCHLCRYEHNLSPCPYYQHPVANGCSNQVDPRYNQFQSNPNVPQALMHHGFYPPTSASPTSPSLLGSSFQSGSSASPLSPSGTAPFLSPTSPSSEGSSWMPVDDPYNSVYPAGSYDSSQSRNSNTDTTSFLVNRMQVGSVAITAATRKRRTKKESTFFCPVLGCNSEGFTEKHNLVYHMRSHGDIRPYECTRCGKCFRSQSDLTRHINKAKRPCEDRVLGELFIY